MGSVEARIEGVYSSAVLISSAEVAGVVQSVDGESEGACCVQEMYAPIIISGPKGHEIWVADRIGMGRHLHQWDF